MIGLKHKIQDIGARTRIKQIEQRLTDPRKPLDECGLVLIRSIAKNFKEGGRPNKWEPSHRAKTTGGKTLIKTARLLRSINKRIVGKSLIVGTNVKYARIHQLGGEIDKNVTVKEHFRYITKAFGKPIKGKRIMVKSHQRNINLKIPARPYLVVQDADWKLFKRIISDHICRE